MGRNRFSSELGMGLAAIIAGTSLSGCALLPWWSPREQAGETDPLSLDIRIGRLGVILNQGYAAKALLLGREETSPLSQVAEGADAEEKLKAQYLALYLAVLGHNALMADACAEGLIGEAECAEHYIPTWLVPPAKARPTPERIDRWSAEAQNAMLPLWARLCDRAIAKTGDEYLCAIE